MLDEFNSIDELFTNIDKHLNSRIKLFMIGGAALMYQGLKPATKDIDIVVNTKKEFIDLQKALQILGFESKLPGKEYSKMNLSQIFEKEEFRIDLFEKDVCGKFSLTSHMVKRAKPVLKLKNIELSICSNEDIFLFKTITEREGDLDDCLSIARAGIDWKIILEELKNQIKKSKQDVWITWVGERLDILEDRGLAVPVMKQINKLRDEYFTMLYKRRKT